MSISAHTIVCSVYDDKAKFYSTPFFSQNEEVAIRDFVDILQNKDNPMSNNRNDYSLVTVGTFSADTAVLVGQTQRLFSVVLIFSYYV